jgi:diguanylate cyclase (GGDEF)-like protein
MGEPLHVLIVEDSEADAKQVLDELGRGGYDVTHSRVNTAEAMGAALQDDSWQIVFSAFSMTHFNAYDALTLLHQSEQDIPFIIVSGSIGEDRAVAAMKAGAHDYIKKGNLKRLLPAVQRELREARVRQERLQAEQTIRRLAYTDPVTDLPNRAHFREQVQKAIDNAHGKHALALLLMDLSRFKQVNDTLGHVRGDILLRQVGTRLRDALFIPDVVARLGGDEFGVLLPRLASSEDIALVLQKIQGLLEEPFIIDGIPIAVEASIGVAIMPIHGDDVDMLLQRADIAMYRAKDMAHNYAVYVPEADTNSTDRLGLMAELRDAIEQNQLVVHFQPQVEMTTRTIVGNEALVRWQHPRRGLLMPDEFIPSAEYTGLIMPLTRWVLAVALRHCKEANAKGMKSRISVNLSARSLHDPRLLESVWSTLDEVGTDPRQLTLEITESAIMLDPKHAEESLAALHAMGIALAIDDFGTGYTSLASIKRLPVDEIKIDKSFVMAMLSDKNDAMIVRSIIDLGHNMGLRVVAEGVASQEIFDALLEFGCDEAQGYYISQPQECQVLSSWLAESPWQVPPQSDS